MTAPPVSDGESVSVTWTAPANGGSNVTQYTVTANRGANLHLHIGDHVHSPRVGSGSLLQVQRGGDQCGGKLICLPSEHARRTGPIARYAGKAAGTSGGGQVALNWPAAEGNGAFITSYLVTSSPDGRTRTASSPFATPPGCTVTGLTNGTAYTFTVKAANAAFPGQYGPNSAASEPVTPIGVPSSPRNVSASAQGGSLLISWVAPSSLGGVAKVDQYEVIINNSAAACGIVPGGMNSCEASGAWLVNGCYNVQVRARNSAGWSAAAPNPPLLVQYR